MVASSHPCTGVCAVHAVGVQGAQLLPEVHRCVLCSFLPPLRTARPTATQYLLHWCRMDHIWNICAADNTGYGVSGAHAARHVPSIPYDVSTFTAQEPCRSHFMLRTTISRSCSVMWCASRSWCPSMPWSVGSLCGGAAVGDGCRQHGSATRRWCCIASTATLSHTLRTRRGTMLPGWRACPLRSRCHP